MKKLSFILIIIFTLVIRVNSQKNYYVALSGDDNNTGTSLSDAWKTIQKAANKLEAGDSVFITKGIYEEIVIPANSGTEDNYITYTAYANDTVIIDGSSFSETYLQYSDRGIFDIKSKFYINVVGLTIRNSNGGGIMCRYGSSYINIKDNRIKNCKATGIGVGYSRENFPLATNVVASGNFVDSCSMESRESISFRSVEMFEIYNNTVQNTPKEAIDAKSGCSNGKIYKNSISNSGLGIYIDAGYPDPLYNSQNNIHVYQNIVKNSNTSYAVASEEGCLGKDIWFYNNIAYDSIPKSGDGFVIANYGIGGPLKDIFIINNTIYNKGHRGVYINNLDVRNIFIRNNITSQNIISQIDVKSDLIDSVVVENNLIDGVNVDNGDFPVFGDPKFVNSDIGDFHLLKTSPAIDNGTSTTAPVNDFDEISRPNGFGYDIGSYEYIFSPSIADPNNQHYIYCYPNPATDLVFINVNDIDLIEIFTSKGELVSKIKVDKNKMPILNLSNKPRGIYFIRIYTNDRTMTQKIVLQ